MKKYLLPLILILLLTFTLTGFNADLYGTYDQRIKLTIDNTKIDATLTWFPVTVFFTNSQGEEIFTEFDADTDYNKVCFTKADGITALFAECELFDDSEQKAVYHVSTNGWDISSSADTDYYMYYDNDYVEVWEKKETVISPADGFTHAIEPNVIYEGSPQILEDDNVFKMWYRLYVSGSDDTVCYAESADGETWTKYDTNPVLSTEGEQHLCPFVFKDGATYYMYVHSDWDNIDRYSSADGLDWSKDKDNALSVGAGGQWDDDILGNVFVWKEDTNDWRMLYEARGSDSTPWKIGYATSADGETWSKSGSNPVLSDATTARSHAEVHKIGSIYYMFYHLTTGLSDTPWAIPSEIGLATSTNLISWTEYGGNPIFFRTESYEGVDNAGGQVADMCVVETGGNTYMFYSAAPTQTPPANHTIALAKSTLGLNELVQTPGMNHTGTVGSPQSKFVWQKDFQAVYHMKDGGQATTMKFYQKGATSYPDDGQIFVTDSGDDWVTWNFSYTADWQEVEIDLTSPDAAYGTMNWEAITSYRFDLNTTGRTTYIDNIRFYDQNGRLLHSNMCDSITSWTAYNGTRSLEETIVQEGSGSLKLVSTDADCYVTYNPAGAWNWKDSITDSTFRLNHGIKKNTNEPMEAAGKVGQGQDFEPTDDEISISDITTVSNFTVEAVTYPHLVGQSSGEHPVFAFDNYDASPRECLSIKSAAAGSEFHCLVDGTGEAKTHTFVINTWTYIAAVRNSTTVSYYADGADLSLDSTVGGGTVDFLNIRIGGHYYLADEKEWFDGINDEVRISNTNRAAAWLKATYNTLYDTLLTYGSEETPTGITWNGVTITKLNGVTITKINGK